MQTYTDTRRVKSRNRTADVILPWKQTCCWTWSGPHERTTKQKQTPTGQTDSHDTTRRKQGYVTHLHKGKEHGINSGTQRKAMTASDTGKGWVYRFQKHLQQMGELQMLNTWALSGGSAQNVPLDTKLVVLPPTTMTLRRYFTNALRCGVKQQAWTGERK